MTIKHFNKLVRNNIPEKIKEKGETVWAQPVIPEILPVLLKAKFNEEVSELADAHFTSEIREELVDLLTVLKTYALFCNINWDGLQNREIAKTKELGDFSQGVFLFSTSKKDE